MSDTQGRPVSQLADDLSLPPFWQEIWREAKARDTEPARQSCFNDGAHFVITALKDAAKALVRLRKIEDAHDGPWEDEQAFQVFNRQITQAYHATSERWAEIAGVETVDSMWAIPEDDALQASEEREQRLRAEIKEWRDDWARVEHHNESFREARVKLDGWLAILDGGKP